MGVVSRSRLIPAVAVAGSMTLTLSIGGDAGAQGTPAPPIDPLHADVELSAPAPRRTDVALTSSALRDAVAAAEAGLALPAGVDAAGGAGGEVLVEVHSSLPPDELAAVVEDAGGTVHGGVDGWFAEAWVPLTALEALEARPEVDYVSTPTRADIVPDTPPSGQAAIGSVQAGAVAGEQMAKTNSAAWNAAGITGAGVRIGIIDFFDAGIWNAALAKGDVVPPAGTRCRTSGSNCDIFTGGSGHGVAVAEVIHDVAPAAQIYLATASTTADLAFVVDWMIDNGVSIISRSLGSKLDGPGDGTGPTADIVDTAVEAGITWFNSAGNKGGNDTNDGGYWRGTVGTHGNGDYIEFAPGLFDLAFTCGYIQGVRWDDWGVNPTDYDVEVWIDTNNDIVPDTRISVSADDQAGSGVPPVETELACDPTRLNFFKIAVFDEGNGTNGDVMEIHLNNGILERWQNSYSVTQPAADSASPGMVTVGAVGANDNPFSTSLAFYSSRGPTNDGRTKPDISAATCLSTVAYGSECFNGTSAATPVAAAIGALAIDAGLASTPAEVKQFLIDNAVDRGTAGPDQGHGWGEIILPGSLESLTPVRVFDTRLDQSPDALRLVDKQQIGGSRVLSVQMTGLSGRVPSTGVGAVSLNVVATGSTEPGYITVYPCGTRGEVSSVNFAAGQTVANAVVAPVSSTGTVCFYSPTPVDVIADLNGYFESTSAFVPVTPDRVFDTRPGQSPDALRTVAKQRIANSTLKVKVTDLAGVVPATGVEAVSLNVVATGPDGPGYLTVYPCGTRAEVSSVNFTGAGQTVANAVVAPVSSDGHVCFYSPVAVDVIADINGWYASTPVFTPVSPARLFDTRPGQSPGSLRAVAKQRIGGLTTLTVKVTSLSGKVPASGVAAVSLNVVATTTNGPGYVTVYPCGTVPSVSSVNFTGPGQTVANAVVAPVSDSGTICFAASTLTDVLVDLNGWYAG